MKKKAILNSVTKQRLQSVDESIEFGWESDVDKGVLIKNTQMGVNIYQYAVFDTNNDFKYDTIGIEEREGNCVSVVLNQENEICLLKEYRFMPDKYFLSCPRGFSDSQDEKRLDCALREVREEIGDFGIVETVDLGNLYQNTTFFLKPIGVKVVRIDVNKNIEISKDQQSEDIINVAFYKPEIIKKMINEGKIECLITLGALLKYFSYIENKQT
jgi:ADP-ribose pyrophosphatase